MRACVHACVCVKSYVKLYTDVVEMGGWNIDSLLGTMVGMKG